MATPQFWKLNVLSPVNPARIRRIQRTVWMHDLTELDPEYFGREDVEGLNRESTTDDRRVLHPLLAGRGSLFFDKLRRGKLLE